MRRRFLAPVLVGRQEELSELEDALLTANRGEGHLVLLAGEAGIGKTRLSTELVRRAGKLGNLVLWGGCSEPELSLPYLPFVEAIGNHLATRDPAAVRAELGLMAAELAQLFPQLGEDRLPATPGDAGQAKLRLFESVVTLLELWARDRGLLLVLEDVHWADGSTLELIDYMARRLVRSRVMFLATYRSDELDRLHPLTRTTQAWRRGGLAETVEVGPMEPRQTREMIAAILDVEDVSPDLVELVHARSEGNPFVLEEMLKEALDRGELSYAGGGAEEPPPLATLRMPETVREAVLLRLGRLDPAHVEVLRAAAILGRSFDYGLLVEVAEAEGDVVLAALEAAVAQQLVEETAESSNRYMWRHALTQETIVSDTVVPKRQRLHSRAADVLQLEGSAMVVASHLIEAGRAEDAAAACLRAAADAERAVAFAEAAELLERVLPHVSDPIDRARLLDRVGRLRWSNGEPAAAAQVLVEAVELLESAELEGDAARARVYLGRCRWELDDPEGAMNDFELARDVLEQEAPSPDLALAYLRIAGIHAFQLDYEQCLVAAERAAEIAEAADADFERVWALSGVALGYFGTMREFEILDRCFEEAIAKGYTLIAGNVLHNEVWDRVHTLAGGVQGALDKLDRMAFHPYGGAADYASSWATLGLGAPKEALELARRAALRHESLGASKFSWRARLTVAEALLELGRFEEAEAELPPPSPGNELQDIVYDTPARVGVALTLGRTVEALELARRAVSRDALLIFRETVAIAVEVLVAAGAVDEAEDVVRRSKLVRANVGASGLDLSEGRILLASGKPAEARAPLERACRELEAVELRLWAWRARLLAGDAAGQAGDRDAARSLLQSCALETHAAGAFRIRDEAHAVARRLGIELEPDDVSLLDVSEPHFVQAGERLVTSMFADVRGYTQIASASAPEDLADRIGTLQRWASTEIGRRRGIVDKFAGDAVMATFNVSGARVDHAVLALEAALALRDKAALMDLPVGIGVAVGPAIVTRSVDDGNLSVLGPTTNLAARLQQAADGGEILLSHEAFRRVDAWLRERGLTAQLEELALKGFDETQSAYRLAAPVAARD